MRVWLQAPGHASGLLLQLNGCRQSRRYCDVVLHVGGRAFAAHRAVLACAGEYFRNLFTGAPARPGTAAGPAFSLDFISSANFEKVLTFVYTGEIVTDLMDVGVLYELADRLGVAELVRACHATFPDLRANAGPGGGATATSSVCSSAASCRSLCSPAAPTPAAIPSPPFPTENFGLDGDTDILDLKAEDLQSHAGRGTLAVPHGGPSGARDAATPLGAALQPKMEEGLENGDGASDRDDLTDSRSLPDSPARLAAQASSSGLQVAALEGDVGGAALEEEQWRQLAVDVIELSDDDNFLEDEEDDLVCIENGDVTNGQVSLFCRACAAPLSDDAGAIVTHAQNHVTDLGHCRLCGASFPDRTAAGPHALSHVGVQLFACDMCDLQFCSQNKLLRHHRQATSGYVLPQGALPTQDPSSKLQCAVCSQTLSKDFQTIKDHLLSHVGGQPLTCSVCQLPLPSPCSLLWHFLLHVALPVFCCPHCARCFAERPLLDRHVASHGSEAGEGSRRFPCPLTFRSSSAFQDPLSPHASEPPGGVCGGGVHGWLGKRKADRPPDRSPSPRDGPPGMSGGGLGAGFFRDPVPGPAEGRDGVAGVRSKWYRCRYCGKRFAHSGEFTYHLRIHTGEKPYQCKVCLRFFRGRSTMICHLKTHSGALMYRCTVCGLFFSTLKMVSSHMEGHKDQLPPDFNMEHTFMYNDHSKDPLAAADT